MKKLKQIQNKLRDERSGKVIFLSHCLLNMNARYLGGAFRSSCVSELIKGAIERDIALIQMKCPEQHVWGGILKPLMWLAFESEKSMLYQMRAVVIPCFLFYTHFMYRRIAKSVVSEICDYEQAGYQVIGVIGIDGSPTCGVKHRIDVKKAFDLYANKSLRGLSREGFNQSLYEECVSVGSGIFIVEMKKRLSRKKKTVPFYSHSLLEEMDKKTDSLWEVIQ